MFGTCPVVERVSDSGIHGDQIVCVMESPSPAVEVKTGTQETSCAWERLVLEQQALFSDAGLG